MKTNVQLQPTVFAIFGGSGDLTWRKLMPSLFDLFLDSSMPADFSIIALDRIKLTDKELHQHFREGIVLRFQAKQPGTKLLLQPGTMRFNYQESFTIPIPDAYETLLWDVMNNDATLFMRADQGEAAWQIITPILDARPGYPTVDFPNYAAGTWGPEEANGLFNPGHHWPLPTELIEKKVKK